MALVKFGAGVSQMTGKAGGVVYARNKSGSYQRNWKTPTNPNSGRQIDQRGYLAAVSFLWRGLTDPQRAAWDEYAAGTPVLNRLGESVHNSGFNFFLRLNTLRLQAGMAADNTAPTSPGLGPDPIIEGVDLSDSASGTPNALTSTLSQYYNAVGDRVFAYIGLPVSAGRIFYKGPWLWAGVLPGNTVQPMEFVDVEANTGVTLTAGEIRFVAFRMFNDNGRVSNLVIGGPFTVVNVP